MSDDTFNEICFATALRKGQPFNTLMVVTSERDTRSGREKPHRFPPHDPSIKAFAVHGDRR